MPDVRLSGDFLGHKAGEIVDMSNDEYSEALGARVVGKVYPHPVVGVPRREHPEPEAPVPADDEPAKPKRERPPLESFGRPSK